MALRVEARHRPRRDGLVWRGWAGQAVLHVQRQPIGGPKGGGGRGRLTQAQGRDTPPRPVPACFSMPRCNAMRRGAVPVLFGVRGSFAERQCFFFLNIRTRSRLRFLFISPPSKCPRGGGHALDAAARFGPWHDLRRVDELHVGAREAGRGL